MFLRAAAPAFSVLVAIALVSSFGGPAASLPEQDPPTEHAATDHVVAGVPEPNGDAADIHITVFRPAGSSSFDPVPLILHSHGWSGSRTTEIDGFIETLLDEGYGVLSIDMRGHGDSGGLARVHHPTYEIADVSLVIDWAAANLDWVETQAPEETGLADDLVLGAIGGSYGGGYQLLTAALDGRLDAIAPEITWNDLPYALAPNDAIKSDWVHLLYVAGKAFARLAPEIDDAYREAMLTNQPPELIRNEFLLSSPMTHEVDTPTLLIQGIPDTLFNLNQAVWNLQQISATGADVRLFTHLGGHLLNIGGLVSDELETLPVLQPADGGSPCGDVDAVRLAWFEHHLKGEGDLADLAVVSLALERPTGDGTQCLTAASWADVSAPEELDVVVPLAVPAGPAGPSLLLPLLVTGEEFTVAGIGRVSGTLSGGPDSILYFSLAAAGPDGLRVLDAQVTPLRSTGGALGEAFDIELGGVASAIAPDETLVLKVDSWNEQFVTNAARAPGATALTDLTVTVPLAD